MSTIDCSTYYLLLEDSCATQIGKIDQAMPYVSSGSLWMINDQHGPIKKPRSNTFFIQRISIIFEIM